VKRYLKKYALASCMRIHVVDNGPNRGYVVRIDQKYLFRGTNYVSFNEHVIDRYYCGSEDEFYGMSTFVGSNIDGVVQYCWHPDIRLSGRVVEICDDNVLFENSDGTRVYLGNRPILLAIAHQKYTLKSPLGEGLVIPEKISLDDIVIVKTDKDLLKVLPRNSNLDAKAMEKVKRRAGICY